MDSIKTNMLNIDMKKFYIATFGCQMNLHDSEKMAGILRQKGYSPAENRSEADIIIFNTCSIRQKAEQKFMSELGRLKSLKRKRPSIRIAVTGCIAEQRGEEIIKRASHVDHVLGTRNIHLIGDAVSSVETIVAVGDNPDAPYDFTAQMRADRVRAWVSIMYGCNNFCSYCIVPYTRGREVSRQSESILKEITSLSEEGYKEVTLLGQNVNSYRSDCDFPELLERINKIDGIERIRFVTSHPRDFSEKLIDAISGLEKVCEHIHLPLQSGSTRILSLMNRGYSYKEYMDKIERLRNKILDIAITTDIIAGFPGETEQDHKETVNALKEIQYDGIFAFKYSPRPGTLAQKMDGQLKDDIKSERLREILEVQDEITYRKNKALEGRVFEVLVEGKSESDPNKLTGRTRTNKIVNWKGRESEGQMINVAIIEGKKHSLEGRPLTDVE